MGFLKGLLWVLAAVALLAVAMYITGNFELTDRMTGLFLLLEDRLPFSLTPDQFQLVLTVLSLLLAALAGTGAALLLAFLGVRLAMARQRELARATAAKREIDHVKERHQRHCAQLLSLSQTASKRLDKRVLAQAIVEGASRLTSAGQANSAVSLWLPRFETDTVRFEMGLYCEGTFFTQVEFQPTESPFAQVINAQKTLILPVWREGLTIVKPEKAPNLGTLTSALVVPLVIESSVLGFLLIFCHPDVLREHETHQAFYEAMWGELTLALAIAIQGEVAILDRLTGVHNREYFMKRLIQEVERANRFQLPLSLLMIDIDNFKQVNDMLGHPQGDAVLKIISKIIKREVRAIDLVGRYGGEEFIIMLPETGFGEEASNATGALLVAERIRKSVDDEFRGLQKPLNLTVSVGVAVRRFPEDRESDYRELIRLADEQLYRAKATGKNRVCAIVPPRPQAVS